MTNFTASHLTVQTPTQEEHSVYEKAEETNQLQEGKEEQIMISSYLKASAQIN